jgi:hypothetical protein
VDIIVDDDDDYDKDNLNCSNNNINNGNLVHSFHCNIEIRDTENYETNKSRSHCWTVKHYSLFSLQQPHQCRYTDCRRLPPCDPDNDWGNIVLQLPRIFRNNGGSELLSGCCIITKQIVSENYSCNIVSVLWQTEWNVTFMQSVFPYHTYLEKMMSRITNIIYQ